MDKITYDPDRDPDRMSPVTLDKKISKTQSGLELIRIENDELDARLIVLEKQINDLRADLTVEPVKGDVIVSNWGCVAIVLIIVAGLVLNGAIRHGVFG